MRFSGQRAVVVRGVTAGLMAGAATRAWSQDAGTIATQQAQIASQQAMDQAQLASQQAMAQAQLANQAAMAQAQLANQQASTSYPGMTISAAVRRPKFSVKSGSYGAPVTVRLSDPTHHAIIYYTTDGWTPTTASPRYEGPITIAASAHVQAIAVVPELGASPVNSADYTLPAPAGGPAAAVELVGSDGVVKQGTEIPLAFAAPVNSHTAQIGDKIPLRLERPVRVGDRVIDPKDTRAEATVIQADHSAKLGQPGNLTFRVDWVEVGGVRLPLSATRSLEGKAKSGKAATLWMLPGAEWGALVVHGTEAEIAPGAQVIATVVKDVPFAPGS